MTFQKWKELGYKNPEIAQQLDCLDEASAHDAFYKSLEFGTAGMRGLLGVGPNRMNAYTVGKANYGFAKYLTETFIDKELKVAIAYDNRHQSPEFAAISAKILSSFGIKVYVFSSLRPTPELSFAVRELGCVGGIVITASHNPKEYNGYKVYDETGCQLIDHKIARVIELIATLPSETEVDLEVGDDALIEKIDADIDNLYLSRIKAIQLQPKSLKTLKIIFTSQHGTAYPLVPKLLRESGYDVIVVDEQKTHDPDFSNTKTPNPEDERSYDLALDYARRFKADLVLSCDPDADRMGIVVRHNDNYEFLTGNQGGSILQEYIYSTRTAHHALPENPIMFNTVVTSDLGEKIASKYGVKTEKTLTGFKYIGSKIEAHNQVGDAQFVFGYEESYGYLIADFVRDKDALQACLMVAEAANFYKENGETLVDVLNRLYEEHGTHVEKQIAISRPGASGLKEIQTILESFRNYDVSSIAGINIRFVDDFLSGKRTDGTVLDFPQSNVLKFYLEDGSWLAIRPSGTEPKCKFYFCIVGDSLHAANQKYEALANSVKMIANI